MFAKGIAMSEAVTRTIAAQFAPNESVTDRKAGKSTVIGIIKKSLEKALLKKGVSVHWTEGSANPEVLIRAVKIEHGNRLLKLLFPLASPAVVEVEGHVALGGAAPKPYRLVQKSYGGGLLAVSNVILATCAGGIAKKIAAEIRLALDPVAEIAQRRAVANALSIIGGILAIAGLGAAAVIYSGAKSSLGDDEITALTGAGLAAAFGVLLFIGGLKRKTGVRRLTDPAKMGPISPG